MALPVSISGVSRNNALYTQPFISSDGNVYFFGIHDTDTDLVRAFKATDPTTSFSNIGTDFSLTSTNAATKIAAVQSGDNIHVVTVDAAAATAVDIRYHVFSMSSDTWTTTNETIKNDAVYTGLTGYAATATIAIRSDGDVIVLYNGTVAASMGTDYNRVKYARREGGTWTIDVAVDNAGALSWSAMGVIIGSSDRMHLLFEDADSPAAYQRSLTSANTLQSFPASYSTDIDGSASLMVQLGTSYDSSGTQKVRYPLVTFTANTLNAAVFDSADTPTVSVETDITGATLANISNIHRMSFAADGTTLWHLFQDGSNNLFTQSNANGAGWDAPASFYDDASAILGNRANVYTRGSSVVLAMITAVSANLYYHEKQLSAGTTDATFDMDAAATVTWSGRSTAASALDSDAAATLTWRGISTAASNVDMDAISVLTWTGAEIQAATEADWESAAAATVTWGGTGLYSAALDSDAAATVTFNGIATAASSLDSAAAATITWNGISTATSAFDSDAAASLTWNGAAVASSDWSSTAVASLTWVGEEIAVTQAAFDMAATASLTWNGAADASANLNSTAAATVTFNGISTAASSLDSAAAASLAWNGAAYASSALSSAAVASVTFNGTGIYPAALDSAAAASLTWNGASLATQNAAWNAAAAASLTWDSETIVSGYIDTDIDAFATLRMAGGSIRAADWSSSAAATLTWNGQGTAAAAWSGAAAAGLTWGGTVVAAAAWQAISAASVTWTGVEVSGAFQEGAFSIDAMASVTFTSATTAASAFQVDATSAITFIAEATGVAGYDHVVLDGWRRKQEELEAQDEEDMMVITAMILAYLEQNHGYY